MMTTEMATASSANTTVAAGAKENAAPGLRETSMVSRSPTMRIGARSAALATTSALES